MVSQTDQTLQYHQLQNVICKIIMNENTKWHALHFMLYLQLNSYKLLVLVENNGYLTLPRFGKFCYLTD